MSARARKAVATCATDHWLLVGCMRHSTFYSMQNISHQFQIPKNVGKLGRAYDLKIASSHQASYTSMGSVW